ncbi:MAG: FAD-dependent oxidoreductase [Candidatus Berkelbacteria bacterium]|nr:FAD-dependent oxidoreductase [Candidatus Berkelbacteria bacterium]
MIYDLIIVGSGPAGLTAALYGLRYKLKVLVVGLVLGGAMAEAWKIENFPGFKEIPGLKLAKKLKEQINALGGEIIQDEVTKVQKSKSFTVLTKSGKSFEARSLILALGTQRRKLNVPGEEEFHNKGVAYCATCDAPLFKDKIVVVVGGGDSAIKSAMLLAQHAKEVKILVRGNELTGEPTNIESIKKNPKIEIILNVEVKEIKGSNKVESIILNSGKVINTDAVFIEIGVVPASVLVKDIGVKANERGFIEVDQNMKTSLAFVYAAGDITDAFGNFKQVLTAAAQGAVAATGVYKDLTA